MLVVNTYIKIIIEELKNTVSNRVFSLDLLRTIAISFVFLSHSELLIKEFEYSSVYFHYLGFQGVELFFALSGFLIGSILLKNNIICTRSLFKFYFRRWMRTLPAFYISFIILYLIYRPDFYDALSVFTFSRNLIPVLNYSQIEFFSVSWSLAIEEWFYLMLGLFLFIFKSSRNVAKYLWIFFIIFRILFMLITSYIDYDLAHTSVVLRFDALLVGVIAASYKFKHEFLSTKAKKIIRITYLSGIFLGIMLWITFPWIQYSSKIFAALFLPLNSIFLALLVFDFSYKDFFVNSIKISNKIKIPIFLIAILSYSIYLLHLEIIKFSSTLFYLSPVSKTLLAIIMTILVASFSYLLLEKPFLKLRDRLIP